MLGIKKRRNKQMFLNINKFSKLAKEAYKFELIIGDIDDHTIITSNKWLVSIENEFVPNKVKALIMELAGRLPKANTVYKIGKSIEVPEDVTGTYLIPIRRLIENSNQANIKFAITTIIDDRYSPVRLLQNTRNSQIVAISESQYQLIDKGCINYEIEGEPTGPCSAGNDADPIYWHNSIGLIMLVLTSFKNTELLDALRDVDFSDKEKIELEE
jgi:hypothetical protein